jgi:hypothetical protein
VRHEGESDEKFLRRQAAVTSLDKADYLDFVLEVRFYWT